MCDIFQSHATSSSFELGTRGVDIAAVLDALCSSVDGIIFATVDGQKVCWVPEVAGSVIDALVCGAIV